MEASMLDDNIRRTLTDEPRIVWRVNKLRMELVPDSEIEKAGFFSGDSYLVLNRKISNEVLIHFLHGKTSSQDERFYAAQQANELDDEIFNGCARQLYEEEGHETAQLLSIFKKPTGKCALRWRRGGYDSFLTKSEKKLEAQMYHIKGKKRVRATEVEVAAKTLTSDDCFVLDDAPNSRIFIICGNGANFHEKQSARGVAYDIRDHERQGKAHIHFLDASDLNEKSLIENDAEVKAVRKILECGNKPIPLLPSKLSDENREKQYIGQTKLHKVSNAADGKVCKVEELGGALNQKQLDEKDCFILETSGGNVFVWRGRHSNKEERQAAALAVQGFKEQKGLPAYLTVEVINQFSEPAVFRSCFPSWRKKDEQKGLGDIYTNNNIAKAYTKKVDARSLHQRPSNTEPIDSFKEDDGTSTDITIYRVNPAGRGTSTTLVKCDPRKKGIFFSGESYVIDYQYQIKSTRKSIIYFWQGNDSKTLEKGAAAKLASQLDDAKYHGAAVQVHVVEGKEPPHFLRIFGGNLIVYQGDDPENPEAGSAAHNNIRLFQVRGKKTGEAKVIEVNADASSLNSNDTFILALPDNNLIWHGKGSTGDELQLAKDAAERINHKLEGRYELFEEEKEPSAFWQLLGGRKAYANFEILKQEVLAYEPRLFHCFNKRGSLEVEEVHDFDQDDLVEDDVMFLDIGYLVYMWVGKDAKKNEVIETQQFIKEYIASDPTPRDENSFVIAQLKQGFETDDFKALFGVWEEHRSIYMTSQEMKQFEREANKSIDLSKTVAPTKLYKYAELKGICAEDLPTDVEPDCREEFLEDDEFVTVFNMPKEQFKKLPGWKRKQLRQTVGLF